MPVPEVTAYVDAVKLLGRRELSVAQLRAKLAEREHDAADIDRAITLLVENGSLDDARLARAYVARALEVKKRGRSRIQRELSAIGIEHEVASEVLGEAFGDLDERALVKKALEKKLPGKKTIEDRAAYARVYQFLMRQGFSHAAITAVLRAYRKGSDPLE
jgi:regulatory protein